MPHLLHMCVIFLLHLKVWANSNSIFFLWKHHRLNLHNFQKNLETVANLKDVFSIDIMIVTLLGKQCSVSSQPACPNVINKLKQKSFVTSSKILHHSYGVSLVIDLPSKAQSCSLFCPASTEILNLSPSRQTNSSDNSNMLRRLNRNTYTDFGTAHKHVLILNYIIWVI